jgi:hypothetical protein
VLLTDGDREHLDDGLKGCGLFCIDRAADTWIKLA